VLVLSRRLGEKIVLPGLGITLQVVSIKGNVVRLGIEAPPDVKVLRGELVSPLNQSQRRTIRPLLMTCHSQDPARSPRPAEKRLQPVPQPDPGPRHPPIRFPANRVQILAPLHEGPALQMVPVEDDLLMNDSHTSRPTTIRFPVPT
jgi:carbon storage regulator